MWKLIIGSIIFLPLSSGIKTKQINHNKIVDRHNYYRDMLGVPHLKYSKKCSDFAQNWAEHLAKENDGLSHSNDNEYGENCYWYSGSADENRVVDRWASEKEFFNHKKRTYSHKSGHYSQMIWRDTKLVGTGMAIASDGSEYWVCTYYPAGNYVGEKAY